MKILLANDTYYPHVNGSSYFTQRLAHYLQERGHDVAVIAPSRSIYNTKTPVDNIVVYGVWSISILFYPQFRFCFPPFFIRTFISNVIKEFQPDVIHIQGHFFVCRTTLDAAKKNNISIVATNHFMPENLTHYLFLPKLITEYINKLLWNDFARVFKNADYVTTPTDSAAKLIPQLNSTIKVISNGIDCRRFNPNNNGEYLRQRYQLSKKPMLLYVGRLDREKNVNLVIRAMAYLSQKDKIQFVIAGTGAQKNKLQKLVNKYRLQNVVTFVGFVPNEDLPNLYALAECFINAGTAELQSIVTMEAMATGLPVIAVRAMALPELVHDGENGFLFEDQNYKTLSSIIDKIFSDNMLKQKMGKESLNIIAKHDISKTINAFEEIYNALIQKINI